MAEFSKQYIQNYMPEFEKWDFDIDEEFDNLQPGEYIPLICEGFGFVGIEKQLDGSKFFLYRDKKGEIVEVPYQIADEGTYSYILGED
jgi:hypothetical protein